MKSSWSSQCFRLRFYCVLTGFQNLRTFHFYGFWVVARAAALFMKLELTHSCFCTLLRKY